MLSQRGFWDSRLTLRLYLGVQDVYYLIFSGGDLPFSALPSPSLLLTGVKT